MVTLRIAAFNLVLDDIKLINKTNLLTNLTYKITNELRARMINSSMFVAMVMYRKFLNL